MGKDQVGKAIGAATWLKILNLVFSQRIEIFILCKFRASVFLWNRPFACADGWLLLAGQFVWLKFF